MNPEMTTATAIIAPTKPQTVEMYWEDPMRLNFCVVPQIAMAATMTSRAIMNVGPM